jgi:hypothetical protein
LRTQQERYRDDYLKKTKSLLRIKSEHHCRLVITALGPLMIVVLSP